ncbi:class I SAM-dependent methyltransferase [uncultured Anaerococcus sp.]|uniref:tRNA (mnm(5)s(2)U34)-methyltransferase n=1 Tax=uncultured Anaerococcus sp. TaxID=293428 RepID=UPI00288B7B30|nr:class I SAM-dependent methyltransferase [uncultured Anaerococcus sp.]
MARRLTDLVKLVIDTKKDIRVAADLTVGKGKDSKYILENTNVERLYGFDIQKEAENQAKGLVGDDPRFKFFLASHADIDKYIKENLDFAIYNLGYLPGGDKEITSKYESTIESLEKTLKLLNKNGMVILTIYQGHPAGKKESEELEKYLETLDQKKYEIIKIAYPTRPHNPPYIVVVEKN